MSKTSILGSLKITTKPAKESTNPIIVRREKLLARLQEQREMAQCFVNGTVYVAPNRQRVKINAETGEKTTETVQKRVKTWFSGSDGDMLLEVRYGNVPIEFSPGKTAIEVGKLTRLVATIETVIAAVSAGEVDLLLKGFDKPAKA